MPKMIDIWWGGGWRGVEYQNGNTKEKKLA